jgi:hypothetical protein
MHFEGLFLKKKPTTLEIIMTVTLFLLLMSLFSLCYPLMSVFWRSNISLP